MRENDNLIGGNRAASCYGKVPMDRKIAQGVARRMKPISGRQAKAYLCPTCGKWHIGGWNRDKTPRHPLTPRV
jgi:predicted RNA-binding Zn-ribbon protein involved in translation (DUF1610 family)